MVADTRNPINRFGVTEYYWQDIEVGDLVILHDHADSVNEWMVISITRMGDWHLVDIRADKHTEKTITVNGKTTILTIPEQPTIISQLVKDWIERHK